LLRREMWSKFWWGCIVAECGLFRSIKEDGTVFSPAPPRAILKNDTFPLRDMITARLIGHGTDLFNSFPRTAGLLWRGWFKRPVDLCRAVGEVVFHNHGVMYVESHQYDWVLGDYLESLADMIRTPCPDVQKAEILVELLKFEGALASVTWAPGKNRVSAATNWKVTETEWLT